MESNVANFIVILVYFIAGLISLNTLDNLFFHILGIAFLIAGAFGVILFFKAREFLFKDEQIYGK